MKKTKLLLSSMFDVQSIINTPNMPSFFALILVVLFSLVIVILNHFNAPPEAYASLSTMVPIAVGIANSFNKPK